MAIDRWGQTKVKREEKKKSSPHYLNGIKTSLSFMKLVLAAGQYVRRSQQIIVCVIAYVKIAYGTIKSTTIHNNNNSHLYDIFCGFLVVLYHMRVNIMVGCGKTDLCFHRNKRHFFFVRLLCIIRSTSLKRKYFGFFFFRFPS